MLRHCYWTSCMLWSAPCLCSWPATGKRAPSMMVRKHMCFDPFLEHQRWLLAETGRGQSRQSHCCGSTCLGPKCCGDQTIPPYGERKYRQVVPAKFLTKIPPLFYGQKIPVSRLLYHRSAKHGVISPSATAVRDVLNVVQSKTEFKHNVTDTSRCARFRLAFNFSAHPRAVVAVSQSRGGSTSSVENSH